MILNLVPKQLVYIGKFPSNLKSMTYFMITVKLSAFYSVIVTFFQPTYVAYILVSLKLCSKMDVLWNMNWCKVMFAFLTCSMILFGVLLNFFEPHLPVLITRTFRYGKFACKEESALVKKVEVPKSYFRHFYLTAALLYYPLAFKQVLSVYVFGGEVDAWFKSVLDFSCGHNRVATVSTTHVFIAVVLMLLQAFRRFFDTHFVSVFSQNATMNLSHYLIGMTYYPAVMLVILSEAPKFAHEINNTSTVQFQDIGVLEIFAVLLFLYAWYHQHVATVILANLRKNEKGEVVKQNYSLPQGDWFNYLSSPHSTAEMIMYTALTLLLSNNTSWWYVYGWVLSNQVESILLSHWWYQSHFKNFPKRRKALIPFVY